MTDAELHAFAQKLYEAHIANSKLPGLGWEQLDKPGRSHWRYIGKIALAEIGKHLGIAI